MHRIDELIQELLTKPHPLLVILGATASGKTALSVKIAQKYNGEILSADSRQIYKHLDISTEKITSQEMQDVKHYMIDIVEPDEIYTMGQYKRDAMRIIEDIQRRKRLPMIVGGTGLYIKSIVENYNVPEIEPQWELRKKWQKEAEKNGEEFLHQKLAQVDPEAAAKIHPRNLRYVIRALEIHHMTGKKKTDQKKESKYSTLMLGIEWPREELYDRINKRVESQIERGLLQEIQKVMEKGYAPTLPSMTAIGCKELLPYFKGKMNLEEAKEIVRCNTRGYARRQLTWFRKEKEIVWLKSEELVTFDI